MIEVTLGSLTYGLGAVGFGVIALLLLTVWRGRLSGSRLRVAVIVSALWSLGLAWYATFNTPGFAALILMETARNATWFWFLSRLLGGNDIDATKPLGDSSWFSTVVVGSCIAMVVWVAALATWGDFGLGAAAVAGYTYLGQVVMAVLGLMLVEQLYRNSKREHRWAIKLVCLGLGGMFAFDLYMYSNAMLVRAIDGTLWTARGAVGALVVPLLAVGISRNSQWPRELFISRHIAFHSAALLGAGAYLMLMAGAGYYIRSFGGTWGGVAQTVFFFGAIVALGIMAGSGQVRARIRVLLNKHFFRNKYEYREEWLRFTDVLSYSADSHELKINVITGIANLVGSPCGGLWERTSGGRFAPGPTWNLDVPSHASVEAGTSLVRFLEKSGWVVQLDELEESPELYEGVAVPDWLEQLWQPWLIVPLLQGTHLEGFVVLSRSGTVRSLNWEDTDILKTVGRQAAAHLAMLRVSDALSDAQQFDAFNRLSSYVVHDLKNVAAQLSLVTSNSKRHRDNPEFVADAMSTVDNATERMNRMLAQLRKGPLEETTTKLVNLLPILNKVITSRSHQRPEPTLDVKATTLIVTADAERLATVVEHIVQNAQEATPDDGRVEIVMRQEPGWACVDVRDTGCGMDAEFVARRLFKPFETTKGNAGMGIGVYESREFVQMWGGEVLVDSTPGQGTMFTLRFPMEGAEIEMATATGASA